MSPRTLLLLGTPKGAFLLEDGGDRRSWSLRGPLCEGWPVHDISVEPGTNALLAAAGNPWWGPAVWRSDDLGATWTHSSEGLTYGDAGPKIKTVWNVAAAHGVIWAGVEPAGLFRSRDGGSTWEHVEGLTNHPTREGWFGGNGGLILHTIIPHPVDPDRVWVGISSVGVFATEDGGATWETRNKGVRAGFWPENPLPEWGQCVHKATLAAGTDQTLFQQNHCGVYRSDDGGRAWTEITEGLPTEFGFVMSGHPRDPQTAWTIPLSEPQDGRFMVDGKAAVWRTHDGGATWIRSGEGLPQEQAYIGVLREAMAVDRHDPVGVYFGTSTGQVYGSIDEGETWSLLIDNMPPIWSVETLVLD